MSEEKSRRRPRKGAPPANAESSAPEAGPPAGAGPDVAVQEAATEAAPPPLPADQTAITVSRGFASWLGRMRCSLAFTSYQTGQLFLVGLLPDGRVSFHQQNYVR